jgi:RimJ/RimL family protein N-acetyltransferase
MTSIQEITATDRSLIERAHTYLMRHEAVHCLQLGFLPAFARGIATDVRWWVAEDAGFITGVASRTEGHNAIVSMLANDTVAASFAAAMAGVYPDLPGVIGPNPYALQFATAWTEASGGSFRLLMNEAVYACREVTFPERMPGSARFANELDVPWMVNWLEQFHLDVNLPRIGPEFDMAETIRKRLANGGFVLWLDEQGEVVSLAGFGNPTPNGIRIGPVYSPESQRNRGYGAAVTATATQHLLDSGRSFVFLFADLDYPASNHVYRKIGYQAVAEFSVYAFD